MEDQESPNAPPASGPALRRRAVFVLFAFLIFSLALHFTLGPAITKLSPHWAASQVPDQALSIVTLSQKQQLQVMPKPTPPPPPPLPLPRTHRDLSLLKERELGQDVRMRTIRPPARRVSRLIVERPPKTIVDRAPDANVVAANAEPTPEATPNPGSGRVDTGAKQDDVSGSIVWGDDNPVRLLKSAPLGVDDHAAAAVRVAVSVGPDGEVIDVRIVQSSGDDAIDQAALAAARASTYAPATQNGLPVHGSCVIEFAPAPQTT